MNYGVKIGNSRLIHALSDREFASILDLAYRNGKDPDISFERTDDDKPYLVIEGVKEAND